MFRIKQVIKEKGTTATALAEEMGVSNNTITRVANGVSKPSVDLLVGISEKLDVDIRELFLPTKGGELLNGFVQYKEKVYTINNLPDLKALTQEIENSKGK
ncbi:MAG: helix-turn-helix transcriptional regulator [Bacteroidota bacterium]